MKITVLMENATPSDRFAARHGLSLFLETEGGVRILFDVGPDESFLENALAAGVDVRTAHAAVLSHGHFDHGGGLRAYLDATAELPSPAPIYYAEHAFDRHVAGTPEHHHDIGLDPALKDDPRFIKAADGQRLGDNLLLFSDVPIIHPIVKSNGVLLEETGEGSHPTRSAMSRACSSPRAAAASSCRGAPIAASSTSWTRRSGSPAGRSTWSSAGST